ncbi:transglutaminaseTgpA domain-containing protein [Oceanobacillus sp. Castelsardo]|uniref:transglutaminase TgpA family protein n=1 Tax=Oceanobacillus sp. Castelsardo TaxID=1851204 RepID=UPI000838EB09|nr:transglutaminaseTgpA domain-containing protein [Oceanobacillus sp. Castelsardo]
MKALLKSKSTVIYTSLLYLCGCFLFLEWLYPLQDITDTESISVFIFYAFFCFLTSFLQLKWWLSCLVKGIVLLFLIHWLYFDQSLLNLGWVAQLIKDFSINMDALISRDLYTLTPVFRSFLFFILIALMSYLLHYWFVQMKRIFLFILLTFIYITVLDTFTTYDAALSIVRAFIISLVALAIANLLKEFNPASIGFEWMRKIKSWLLPLLAIIAFSTLVGFVVPKIDPQWPDPVPFIYSAAEEAGGGFGNTIQKVGYGEDDSRLGGSFVQDNTPVFTAYVHDQHYWRIETRDIYTGKGWELSEKPDYKEQLNGHIELETYTDHVETKELTGIIEVQNKSIGKLMYPYGINQAEVLTGAQTVFSLDSNSGAIQTENDSTSDLIYQIQYDIPSFAISQLKNSSEEYPKEILDKYTQLPSTLPNRVVGLAEEITANETNRYDKAKAIEQYFNQNGYEYKTENIPVPQGNEDYVDQFLFDSKIGYCDNFSTSMVVMLRTLDIPARWVKGFTSGDLIESNFGSEPDKYQITNANAHSWVEVYFPEYGWVPFEPTQGFSNLSDFYFGESQVDTEADDDELDTSADSEEEKEQVTEKQEEEEAETAFNLLPENRDTNPFSNWSWLFLIVFVVITIVFLYLFRNQWRTKLVSYKMDKTADAKTFQEAYHHAMKLLQRKGLVKDPNQTLREFAKMVDDHYGTSEMGKLTGYYEQLLYKNEFPKKHSVELTKLWKDLINHIMG